MSKTRIEIDPEGDTLIFLPVKPATTQPETKDSPDEKLFLCSKKHLTLASRLAARLFKSESEGLSCVSLWPFYHWEFDADGTFNPEAFSLVLNIIHGKTRGIPRTIKLDLLADIATIVDHLQCHEAVAVLSQNWLSWYSSSREKFRGKELAQLVLASFVFKHASLFENYTKLAIRHSNDIPPTFGLPIWADISSQIESTRNEIFKHLFDGLDKLHAKILDGSVGCNAACQALRLGGLMQGLKQSGIYPRPPSPSPKLSLDAVLASLANVQSPAYFGPQSQGPLLNYSGRWNLDPTSASVVSGGLLGYQSGLAQGQPKPASAGTNTFSASTPQQAVSVGSATQPASSLFGGRNAPQNTNTRPPFHFGHPSPGDVPGTSPVSQNTSSPQVSSQSGTKGLFGNSGSNTKITPLTAESPDQPQTIVRHHCRLKDLIEPLLVAAEKEITGLKLADFPRP